MKHKAYVLIIMKIKRISMLLTLSYYTGPMMGDCGVRGCYSTERKETILALIIIKDVK